MLRPAAPLPSLRDIPRFGHRFTQTHMTKVHVPRLFVAAALTFATAATAQQKSRYASLTDALQSSPILAGRGAPDNIFWLDGGTRFSFIAEDPRTDRQTIRVYDPATGRDSLLFSGEGLVIPGAARASPGQKSGKAPVLTTV